MDLRSLKTLLWVKRRRLEPLEQQVQAAAAHLAATQQAHDAAVHQHALSVANEATCAAKIQSLGSDGGFRPDEAVTLTLVLQGLSDLVRQAAEAEQAAAAQVVQAQARLVAARQALQRAERQIEQLEDRRQQRLKQIDQEGEDTQDEESEEAAVARKVAQRREQAAFAEQHA
ncbi:hypothetical protein [Roseateles amylovorans]|uniref:Type III secretion protein HrpB7 n=1 Tax=Roseateles amylovorans TaxID=2978473 RepID=A0ABY6B430_9BURK|nr:hypothetical protein [Roseateles amylovorans]UXH78288.1 hypothetical protein N4261_25625 [Roseateles amylovorans]